MPNRDGTGPMGQGPRSGRRRGACSGNDNAGQQNGGASSSSENPILGVGRGGRPRGGGKGKRFGGWKNQNNQ
ncbi:MAG TPA: DUF5320 domain-containing protein [Ignavibacteriales bacterium]|nr:DUF5320 domain-containing protein [Ignavibacteriales bacterium]